MAIGRSAAEGADLAIGAAEATALAREATALANSDGERLPQQPAVWRASKAEPLTSETP